MALSNSSENRDGTPNIVLRMVFNNFISQCLLILIYLYLGNVITGLDFSPNGEIAATMDKYGVCLISDVNTDSYRFHMEMKIPGKQNFLKKETTGTRSIWTFYNNSLTDSNKILLF